MNFGNREGLGGYGNLAYTLRALAGKLSQEPAYQSVFRTVTTSLIGRGFQSRHHGQQRR